MYKITKYKLENGEEFDCFSDARFRLDNLYGDELSKISHDICKLDFKYNIMEYINENLDKFRALIALDDEIKNELDNEEE